MAFKFASLLACLLLLGACATEETVVMNDAPVQIQKVSVNTPGQVGAHCFLQSGMRSYTMSAPGTVNVYRSRDPMTVTCFKGEHMVGTETVRPTMAPREADNAPSVDCVTCIYPATVTVAMGLDPSSFERNLKIGP